MASFRRLGGLPQCEPGTIALVVFSVPCVGGTGLVDVSQIDPDPSLDVLVDVERVKFRLDAAEIFFRRVASMPEGPDVVGVSGISWSAKSIRNSSTFSNVNFCVCDGGCH